MFKTRIIKINQVYDYENWVPIPCYKNKKRDYKFKKLHKIKGNCYFAVGVANGIIDFIYRSVIKLGIKNKKLIFSKGAVKIKKQSVNNAISILDLDWDIGTSFTIPRKLNYKKYITIKIENKKYDIRYMESLILSTLIRYSLVTKNQLWCSKMAICILCKGWKYYEDNKNLNHIDLAIEPFK